MVASHTVGVAEDKVGGAAAPPTVWETPPVTSAPRGLWFPRARARDLYQELIIPLWATIPHNGYTIKSQVIIDQP